MASQDSQPFHWHYAELDDRNFQIRGRTLFYAVIVFSIILVITLLLLYARWICRFRFIPGATTHPQPPPTHGLDSAAINSLPIKLHRLEPDSSRFNESECCICLGMFLEGDKVKVLPSCRHCYHPECVDKWLRTQSSCPLCRSSLRVHSAV